MKFIKRLIILSGQRHKGTLSLERNAFGVFAKFNAYGSGLYSLDLVLSIDGQLHHQFISGSKASFEVKASGELEIIHAAVFFDDKLTMYGTNQQARMSGEQINKLRFYIKKSQPKQVYTTRRPTDSVIKIEYEDEKIAEQNYYPKSISEEFNPSAIKNETLSQVAATIQEQVEEKGQEQTQEDFIDSDASLFGDDIEFSTASQSLMPSQMEKLFILARIPQKKPIKSINKAKNIINKQKEIKDETQTKPQDNATAIEQERSIRPPLKLFQEQSGRFAKRVDNREESPKPKPNTFGRQKQDSKAEQENSVHKVAAVKFQPFVSARQSTFYEQNGEEINKLFSGPRETSLEKLIPGSKWVKINFDSTGKYYVVGLIGQEFLCYGVPSEYSPQPPEELKGYSWWLPIDSQQPTGKGYWIMYQNLITGQTILPTEFE